MDDEKAIRMEYVCDVQTRDFPGGSMTFRFVVFFIGVLVGGGGALAGEYPYSGFFTQPSSPNDDTRCGVIFFHQKPDGSFTGYHLDEKYWNGNKKVRFLRYHVGKCEFDESSSLETCTTERNIMMPEMNGKKEYSKIIEIHVDGIKALSASSELDAKSDSGLETLLKRCPFDEEQIAPLLSESETTYSLEQLTGYANQPHPELQLRSLLEIKKRK